MQSGGGQGRLLALPLAQPLDETATVPLTRAADVLALSLLRARQEEELLARERGNVLAELAGGRLPAADAARRARAMGFTPGPALLPVAAELTVPAEVAAAWDVAVADAQDALERRGYPALLGTRGAAKALLGLVGVHGAEAAHRAAAADAAAHEIRAAVERRLGASVDVVVVAGETSGWDVVASSLALTTEAAASGVGLPAAPWHDVRALELRRLLWRWREDPELAAFVHRTLGPLVEHDRRRAHQLTATLEALVANGGRKAETARALHLNRQALYNRIARIEELLRTDLSDPDQLLTIQLALLARAVLR